MYCYVCTAKRGIHLRCIGDRMRNQVSLINWRNFMRDRKERMGVITGTICIWNRSRTEQTALHWFGACRDAVQYRKKVVFAFSHHSSITLGKCMNSWRAYVRYEHVLKRATRKTEQLVRYVTVRGVWITWRQSLASRVKNRRIVARCRQRFSNRLLQLVFTAWRSVYQNILDERRRYHAVRSMVTGNQLHKCWTGWKRGM